MLIISWIVGKIMGGLSGRTYLFQLLFIYSAQTGIYYDVILHCLLQRL